jgi:hypothetical protein
VDLLPTLLLAGVALVIGALSWLARRSERRDGTHPERMRMPRVVLWVGAGGLALMAIVALASIGSGDAAMTIVPLLVGGVMAFLILLYVNWYLVVEPHQLTLRGALGRVRTIRYDDITRARLVRRGNATQLTIRDAEGTRFSISLGTFDVGPLLRGLRERGWDLSSAGPP